jgi:predicted lipid-binding transport protein (Tim44 family)
MRRLTPIVAVLLALLLLPGLAFARAGSGFSMGSRGGYSFSAPPATRTAPYTAPLGRSMTQGPSYAPGYAPSYGGLGYGYNRGYGYSPFASGLMGGLLGAGIGGLLFGHGMFYGLHGPFSLFGLLIQIVLIVLVVRWLLRLVGLRQPAAAGGYGFGGFGRGPRGLGGIGGLGGMFRPMAGAAPGTAPNMARGPQAQTIAIQQADYLAFEQLLKLVQQAWSGHDLATLRQLATPEMVSYFAEQLAQQASTGTRNTVTDVRLEQGDLAQAWREQGRDYATVAMRFSMIDVTRDTAGRVVDGSPTERTTATEVWTFLRANGGRWILSAIQQTR